MSDLFRYIDFETISTCNRTCPTCIRNSHPDREVMTSRFEKNLLPSEVIENALNECLELGFHGGVCLSYYNEPLLDERIVDLVKIVKSFDAFYPIYFHTNGDLLTSEIANGLDGQLDKISVSLYMSEPIKSQRAEWVRSLFKLTYAETLTQSEHIPTHFSPKYDVAKLADEHRDRTCLEPNMRVIINHSREYMLCCEDVVGNFNLGTFPEISIKDYWFGKHLEISNTLKNMGGRRAFSYCSSCPRT